MGTYKGKPSRTEQLPDKSWLEMFSVWFELRLIPAQQQLQEVTSTFCFIYLFFK